MNADQKLIKARLRMLALAMQRVKLPEKMDLLSSKLYLRSSIFDRLSSILYLRSSIFDRLSSILYLRSPT
jgi:hypothetical protein